MKTKDTVLREHIDEKFSSIEELLRMILVSSVTLEMSLSSNISNIGGQHTYEVVCIKKIYHPIYGESLLSCGRDKCIKFWSI